MQIHHIGCLVKGFYRVAKSGESPAMNPVVEHRLRALEFWDEYGPAAACKAFAVSNSTLYNRRNRLKAADGAPAALMPGSRAPKRRRRSPWPSELAGALRRLRELHPNTGKLPLAKLPTPWCALRGLPLLGASTIGRIIAAAGDKMCATPARLDSRGRPRAAKKQRKEHRPAGHAAAPLEVFAAAAGVRVHDGVRRCLTTFIDPRSRFAFRWASKRASNRHAAQALCALLFLLHRPMRRVLTDNGWQFGKDFENELKKHGIGRWRDLPPVAVVNARCERFSRTIWEDFVDYHEDLLFWDDLDEFNRAWRNGWCSTTPSAPTGRWG